MASLEQIKSEISAASNSKYALRSIRFFKTGPGNYGEGDKFLGINVPTQRTIAKKYFRTLSLDAVSDLLTSPWHEERLIALFILVLDYNSSNDLVKDQIAGLYLANTKYINNWDLVDSSAYQILGRHLIDSPYKMKILKNLARSSDLWQRRIAVVSTFYYIKRGSSTEALDIIEILKYDKHDLIQKASGWMLREIGKQIDPEILITFLDKEAQTLPRITLRYAIERLSETSRSYYMKK